jgi:hypothetical protein
MTAGRLAGKNFDRHSTVKAALIGFIDGTHAALAGELQHVEVQEIGLDLDRVWGGKWMRPRSAASGRADGIGQLDAALEQTPPAETAGGVVAGQVLATIGASFGHE